MTALEMTKLCAQAMGFKVVNDFADYDPPVEGVDVTRDFMEVKDAYVQRYRPLHDDAQAMALVKRFRIHVVTSANNPALHWCCCPDGGGWSDNPDLNRAIVESVAKLHAVGDILHPEKP